MKLIEISKGTNYQICYKRLLLYHLVQKLDFQYKKYDKRYIIMESMKIVVWRYKYLLEIVKYGAQNHPIVYLDETWYDSHDPVKKIWANSSEESNLSAPVSKGKTVVICYACSREGFVDNTLLLCGNVT